MNDVNYTRHLIDETSRALTVEGIGPSKSSISKIKDMFKKQLGATNVVHTKNGNPRIRVGHTFQSVIGKNGIYIEEAYDGIWEVYLVSHYGFPVTGKSASSLSNTFLEITDEATALKAVDGLLKKYKADLK